MASSRLYYSKWIVFGLKIIIITCSLVICQDTLVSIEEVTKNCGDNSIDLSCNITRQGNQLYWYRLSVEQMEKIPHNSLDDFIKYRVKNTFYSDQKNKLLLYYLTVNDTGMYSCLDWSKETGIRVIRRIRLQVKCKGDENKNHVKQYVEKIQVALAPPYVSQKRVAMTAFEDDVDLFIFTRGQVPILTYISTKKKQKTEVLYCFISLLRFYGCY
ncbi:uncharacterized protein LOC135843193 [Planococcus citri]|uniref:uncharacterized protein LOC135843193 n=1 Tax=Planococcus citri TaxID=170843 RepID=UPI0031F75371